jgi:hypothetical protein
MILDRFGWPKSGPANVPSYWRQPRRNWRALRPACNGHAVRCAAAPAAIGQALGAVLGRRHMAKHFQISNAEQVDLAEPHPGAPAPK